ncbi:MAG: GDP-mannose 4,6-dehydratase, partial [Deltaproteobacteria bacterium]|nr:GDP-mannose 4,6-dehydratase [Deltaproteobacteria bacterium]
VKDTFETDITDRDKLGRIIKDIRPDEIYHLAGIADVAHGNVSDYYTVHAIGTLNLYEAVQKADINPKILYVSTSNVYGIVPEEKQPIAEDQPIQPVNHYGASKAAGEMISHKYSADGLRIIIARSFNHTGPGQTESFILPKLAKAFAEKQPEIGLGDTHTKRDFTDVRDVVKAYRMIVQEAGAGEVYNVCSGAVYSIDDMLGYLRNITGHTIRIRQMASLKRTVDPVLFAGDNRRLKKLGWSAGIPIEQTIKDLIGFYNGQI